MKVLFITFLTLTLISCVNSERQINHEEVFQTEDENSMFSRFDSIPKSKIMVVGSYHFSQEKHYDELSEENQIQINKLINSLAAFQPTKVVIEKQPTYDSLFQSVYQKYLTDNKVIDTLENEVFQLGFRLAKKMGHDKIYLFDNQTAFIGSLENFTWDRFREEVSKDSVFVNKYIDVIMDSFNENEEAFNAMNLYDNITERNSPKAQKWNAQRMHAYEIRTGIQDNWIGADWLGRWYQRNIRMMGNIMSFDNQGNDRIVIIVGDNHKWILDTLFDFNPDFEVISSYNALKRD